MQSVFYKTTAYGFSALRELISENEYNVFLIEKERRIRIITRDQVDKFNKLYDLKFSFQLESSKEQIIILENLEDNKRRNNQKGIPEIFCCQVWPKTKKELKKLASTDSENLFLQATAAEFTEYEGALLNAPRDDYFVVGPDPRNKRAWFATISWSNKNNSWIVK